jgi:hypothetical protein
VTIPGSYLEANKMSVKDNMPNGLINGMMDGIMSELERIAELKKSPEGKYRVIGVDKFSCEDWVMGEYLNASEAVEAAKEFTINEMAAATDPSIATVFYAYDPSGKYIGGDIWRND